MATITLKGVPDGLYERIRRSAAENRRSINKEIMFRLEYALTEQRPVPLAVLERIDRLRARAKLPPVSERWLKAAKEKGRA
ncbi:MAG TPA: Arc family DNA-binding protein [Candidatus Hydrogenedentes bacterium]|nr:Arc family DNA-binding protein [Candidatus Hydrogenedentota bacterium]HNT86759.1 Arc family DNA-binding protein [Candidatus Hydrogenedentota bacterium]